METKAKADQDIILKKAAKRKANILLPVLYAYKETPLQFSKFKSFGGISPADPKSPGVAWRNR